MLLAIDVGNTNTVLGLFDHGRLVASYRLETRRSRPGDEYAAALETLMRMDPALVDQEARLLGAALKSVFESLHEKGSALVVGHSPTTEAAVFGLTGVVVEPVAKGGGIRVVEEEGRYKLEALPVDR